MVKWAGFAFAAAAAIGHSGIDATRKHASQRFNSAELVGLVGLLDAAFLSIFMLAFGLLPNLSFLTYQLCTILLTSAAVKILAGVMYQRALQVSPLSVTVPYLAFIPAMLLLTSFVLLHEMPNFQGIIGVMVVTAGGYMLALDSSKPAGPRAKSGAQAQGLLSSALGNSGGKQVPYREEKSVEVESDAGLGSEFGLNISLGKTPMKGAIGSSRAGSGFSWRVGDRLGWGIGLGGGPPGGGRGLLAGQRGGGEGGGGGGAKGLKGRHEEEKGQERLGVNSDAAAGSLLQDDESKVSFMEGYAIRGVLLTFVSSIWLKLSKVLEPLQALRKEEGSLLMLGCAALLSLTNSFDKMGVHHSPSIIVFAALQRILMAIPPIGFLVVTSPRSFLSLFHFFPIMAAISCFEMLAIVCYLKSLDWLLVSYAVAAKRSNILISVLVGYFMFKENIWRRLPFILLMVLGMILILFAS